MSFVISGASAEIAGLTAEELVKSVSPDELILVTRNPGKLNDWATRGAQVVEGDPSNREALQAAYEGGERLFLVSGINIGERIVEHQNAIDAAKAAGIRHITYTSVAGAHKRNPTPSAKEHIATELNLFESGVSFAALRNQMYIELVYPMIRNVSKIGNGKFRLVGEKGHVAPVSRRDIAACAAAIMLTPEKHDRFVYDITGPVRFTYAELTAIYSKVVGREIEYVPISPEEMYAGLEARGWPRAFDASLPSPACFGADETVQQFIGNEAGFQDVLTSHVEMITGRKPIDVETIFREIHRERAD